MTGTWASLPHSPSSYGYSQPEPHRHPKPDSHHKRYSAHRKSKGPQYYHDEKRNIKGPHRCRTSWDCDGNRTCSQYGWCQGKARPKHHAHHYPPPPPHKPVHPPHHERPSKHTRPSRPHASNHKGPHYYWNESKNPGGAHRCTTSMQCSGTRTCSSFGWCQD